MGESLRPTPRDQGIPTEPDKPSYNAEEGNYPPYPRNPERRMSATAFFHLAGDVGGEIDRTTGDESSTIDTFDPNLHQKIENKNIAPERYQHLRDLLALIGNVKLAQGDARALTELARRKETARRLIRDIFDLAEEYFSLVESFSRRKVRRENQASQSEYVKEFEDLDRRREAKHNALVDAVNIASRYISNQFGKLESSQLDSFEEHEEEAGRMILDVRRVKLPRNLICTDEVHMGDRKSIATWAFRLANEARDQGIEKIFPKKKG